MKFPRNKISASLINAYYDCPLGWKLTVIDELMVEEGPALEIGSMFDFMFKNYHEKKDWHVEAKTKFLNGRMTKQKINNFAEARKLMEAYLKDLDVFVNPSFDIKFEVPIINPITKEEIKGILLKGFLDGFDNRRIKELKSTTEDYTQERVDNALQAKIYSYGKYMLENEIYPVDYIVVSKRTGKVSRFSTTPSLEDFAMLFDKIKEFIALVEAEKFDRSDNCPFYCPCRKLKQYA